MAFWNSQDEYEGLLELVRTSPDRLSDFALVYHRDFLGIVGFDEWGRLLMVVAKMCCEVYKKITSQERRVIKENLCFEGTFFEPSIYEDSNVMANAHQILNIMSKNNGDPILLELLLIAHDLEFILRPNILRLNWLVRRTDGEELGYDNAQLNKNMEQGSIGYGISHIQEKLNQQSKHSCLSENDKNEIGDFLRSLSMDKIFPFGAENLRNWIAHRDFFVSQNEIILNFHPYPGKRISLTKTQVTQIRQITLGLVALCITIDAIFKIASEANLGIMEPKLILGKKP